MDVKQVRDLGLQPGDWEKGVEIIRAGRRKSIDVGQVTQPGDRLEGFRLTGGIGLSHLGESDTSARAAAVVHIDHRESPAGPELDRESQLWPRR